MKAQHYSDAVTAFRHSATMLSRSFMVMPAYFVNMAEPRRRRHVTKLMKCSLQRDAVPPGA